MVFYTITLYFPQSAPTRTPRAVGCHLHPMPRKGLAPFSESGWVCGVMPPSQTPFISAGVPPHPSTETGRAQIATNIPGASPPSTDPVSPPIHPQPALSQEEK